MGSVHVNGKKNVRNWMQRLGVDPHMGEALATLDGAEVGKNARVRAPPPPTQTVLPWWLPPLRAVVIGH